MTSNTPKQKPVHDVRFGNVNVAIWANRSREGDTFHTFVTTGLPVDAQFEHFFEYRQIVKNDIEAQLAAQLQSRNSQPLVSHRNGELLRRAG